MKPCAIHRAHDPEPKGTDTHHVIPLSWWPSARNRSTVVLDPTAHRNVHEFIDLLVAHKGAVPWSLAQHFFHVEREIAAKGYAAALAKGFSPRPTL